MAQLRNVDDAIQQILATITPLSTETITLPDAGGRVLAQDIESDVNLPPFDNSAMDGYAIHAEASQTATQSTPVELDVTMDIPAGVYPTDALDKGQAARIMTGAPLPSGATAVIPVEATDSDFSERDGATLPATVQLYEALSAGANIRQAGENIRAGQLILKAGSVIRPQDIGMLAAIGRADVPVVKRATVVIVGSGDELVDVTEPLQAGQIRDVNSYTLAASVQALGGQAIRLPIAPDTPSAIRQLFTNALAHDPDLIISSAGVSVGAADYVRTILEEMGAIDFWKINLRPGKPLAYGHIEGVPFFGLPGNPVSAMITFDVLVRPLLHKLMQQPDTTRMMSAITGEAMRSDGRRTYARVTLERDGDTLIATESGTQSSGALMSMVIADGLLIIPEGMTEVEAGTRLPVRLLREI
jgi:molybdopterin molybdotransferase